VNGKEAVVVCFKVLSWNLLVRTREGKKNLSLDSQFTSCCSNQVPPEDESDELFIHLY
jgi:hypothetical protein